MARDLMYTNGVIAVKERYLLKDKLLKLCGAGAEEAFRTLTESGFGKGAEVSSVYEYEKLVAADERSLDAFIREYSPSEAEAEYLLAARDFHNAKAAVKAYNTGADMEKMLAPDGLVSSTAIINAVKEHNFSALGKDLREAVEKSNGLFEEENRDVSGAEIGMLFEKALYSHLSRVCSKNRLLKSLLAAKADMTNILTALRSSSAEYAEKCYVDGGSLSVKKLNRIFDADADKAERALEDTPYADFYAKCFADKAQGLPLTRAERVCESYETEYFSAKKYDLQKNQPFLYYVFRRRAENANVRILFVCLLADMSEGEIKKRLRTF